VIPVAFAPSGGQFNCNMHVPTGGMPVTGGLRVAQSWTGPEPAGTEGSAAPEADVTAR
jgi:hypothetical protein